MLLSDILLVLCLLANISVWAGTEKVLALQSCADMAEKWVQACPQEVSDRITNTEGYPTIKHAVYLGYLSHTTLVVQLQSKHNRKKLEMYIFVYARIH